MRREDLKEGGKREEGGREEEEEGVVNCFVWKGRARNEYLKKNQKKKPKKKQTK